MARVSPVRPTAQLCAEAGAANFPASPALAQDETGFKPYWMRAADQAFCYRRTCGTKPELGAACKGDPNKEECCTVTAQGGSPQATCSKPESGAPATCQQAD